MADWSHLPKDILLQINDSLRSPIDVLRLRSVCSAWRSTIKPKTRSLPDRFPIIPIGGISDTAWGFRLVKHTTYRFSIPPDLKSAEDASDWIIKISEAASGRMQLMNPITRKPSSFSGNLDLLKIRVCEVGEENVMKLIDYRPQAKSLGEASTLYDETVAFRQDVNTCGDIAAGFEILTIKSERLAMFKSGDKKWKLSKEMWSTYVEVTLFKGKFYAVDSTGRMVIVDSGLETELVAESVFGGEVKFLVESCGHLLLVDMWLDTDVVEFVTNADDEDDDATEKCWGLLNERSVSFKIYKLVENKKKWEEMKTLGDQILILGRNHTYSVSAVGCSGYEENCLYATFCRNGGDDRTSKSQVIGVLIYHLDRGKIEFLTDESKYWKLFWPPPAWVSNIMGGN